MIPTRLSLSGFLSYSDPVSVDFGTIDLACISGENGAGKSSLLDAITWALFGQARKRDDSIINTASDGAEVTLEFEYENDHYRVIRSKMRDKPTLLEFFVQGSDEEWKPLSEKNMRETENRIQKTLNMDYETFINASFFLQGKADLFTQQRPSERKRILGSILGLDIWETYRETSAARRKRIEGEVTRLEGNLQEIQQELDEEPQRTAHLKQLEEELEKLVLMRKKQEEILNQQQKIAASLQERRSLLEAMSNQLQSIRQNLTSQEERLAARQGEKDAFTEKLVNAAKIEADYQKWQKDREDLGKWEKTASQFHEQEKQRNVLLVEIDAARNQFVHEKEQLETEAENVRNEEARIIELERTNNEQKERLDQLTQQTQKRASLEAELQTARQKQADAKAENPILKQQMEELKERIDQLSQAEGATCPLCNQPLSPSDRKHLLDELTKQGKSMGDRYRENVGLLKDFEPQVKKLETETANLANIEEEIRNYTRQAAESSTQLEHARQIVDQWSKRGAVRLREIETVLKDEAYAQDTRAKLDAVNASLKLTGYDAATHDAIRRAESEGRHAEEDYRALEVARAALAPLEREINELSKQIENQREEVERLQAQYDTAAAALAEANMPDINAAEQELNNIREQVNVITLEVGGAKQKVQVLADLRSRQADLNKQKEDKALQISRYKTLERAFSKDGVPALLIEQALPEIEIAANEILDRLTAGKMSVSFSTQRAYKDKNREDLKETLDILISDSAGTRDYEMFSGGEAFRINFAIRLALSRVLAHRAGARLQTLVIDEGFGNQDTLGRQRLVEAINLASQDFRKIFVITHLEELKEIFPCRIEVEKTPRGSTIKVI